ncbi:tRNA (guanosine(46)-N7)-methyltransferase TrmB [Flammeovirgaceae bacterium SG7u.111]|nr:tRNA (guanosine(46)-N7)-methyltransferase TrmB [Flammeovirgaceae bacterium SG7u.132]WPO36285.1 tRNA (guanosine(46)-N7)-methyltransferase TrmB [Flammeovirgaceae bacterium SG7u.111]
MHKINQKNKMARSKKKKFSGVKASDNVLEAGKKLFENIKGNWNELFFQNDNDIVLELACGRGEYSVGLGEIYPNKNFIGIDIKGDRLWFGSSQAEEKGLKNVGFLRTKIHHLEDLFAENEVADIWIINPDPRPRKRDIRRRLTNPRFMGIYHRIMKPGGWIRLKTDSQPLFEYSLEEIKKLEVLELEKTFDLYESPLYAEHHNIKTRFESIFTKKGHKIHYLKAKLAEEQPSFVVPENSKEEI